MTFGDSSATASQVIGDTLTHAGEILVIVDIGTRQWTATNLGIVSANAALDICPAGWSLPSKVDFESLLASLPDSAGYHLQAWSNSSVCNSCESGSLEFPLGDNSSGFGASRLTMPGNQTEQGAFLWTSDRWGSTATAFAMTATTMAFGSFAPDIEWRQLDTALALPVRCVRNP